MASQPAVRRAFCSADGAAATRGGTAAGGAAPAAMLA